MAHPEQFFKLSLLAPLFFFNLDFFVISHLQQLTIVTGFVGGCEQYRGWPHPPAQLRIRPRTHLHGELHQQQRQGVRYGGESDKEGGGGVFGSIQA